MFPVSVCYAQPMGFKGLRGAVIVVPLLVLACDGRKSAGSETVESDAGSLQDAATQVAAGSSGPGGMSSVTTGGSSVGTGGAGGAKASGGVGGLGGSGGASGAGGASSTGGTPATGGQGSSCLPAGSFCTWSNADDCCSGSCDGDSCCGYLGDACSNGFGCCEGDCIAGHCQCPPGTLDCGGGCVDIEWNENRCGDCDTKCGVNSLCEDTRCICDPNLFDPQFYVRCPGGCFNTRQDEQHCGDCTTVCSGGTQCSGGTCTCPSGTLDCGDGCEDITTNALHCGSCDNACAAATENCTNRQCQCKPGLFACTPGVCVDRQTDESNCGTCGVTCVGSKTCQSGLCKN